MLRVIVYTRDTRIRDVDYLIEDVNKLYAIVPYLRKKIEGEWNIALFQPPIKYVRDIMESNIIPDYVNLDCYLDRAVAEQLMIEKPSLSVKVKSAYEKYLDVIAELKVLIEPKAAKELYSRVGVNKDKLQEYLVTLSERQQSGVITVKDVKDIVVDERKIYASDVLMAFFTKDRGRWKKYDEFVATLGRDYAFYSLRKYINKMLKDKNNYLRNQDTQIRGIDKIDSFKINQCFILFNTTKPCELDMCMYMLDNRESMRRVL